MAPAGKSRRNRRNRNYAAHPYAMPPMPPMPPYGFMPMQMPYQFPMQMHGNMPANVTPNMMFQQYPGQRYYGYPGFPANFPGTPNSQGLPGAALNTAAPAASTVTGALTASTLTAPGLAANTALPFASVASATSAPAAANTALPFASVASATSAPAAGVILTTTASVVTSASTTHPITSTAEMPLGDLDLYDVDSDESDLKIEEGSSTNCIGMYLPKITKPNEGNSTAYEPQESKGKGRQKGNLNKATVAKLDKEAAEWMLEKQSKDQAKTNRHCKKVQPKEPKVPAASRQLRRTVIPKKLDLSKQFSNSEDEDGDL